MVNPFDNIDARLSNIESLLLEIKHQKQTEELPENYNVKEAASLLKVSEQSIHAYIKKGLIPAKKVGRIYLIKRVDLEDALTDVKSLKYKRVS